MKLKTKLQVALLFVAALSILLTGWQSFQYSRNALETITFARLTAVRETKKEQIESYFRQIRNQLVTLAEDRATIEAMRAVSASSRTTTGRDAVSSPPYAQLFRTFAERFGYDDIMLANDISGEVFFSLSTGGTLPHPLRPGAVQRSTPRDQVHLQDFAAEGTRDSLPVAFASTPVFDGASRLGVLVFRISAHSINALMTSQTNWEQEGLGKTGETYIVGPDFTMRNDSRFFVQDSSTYFERLRHTGADSRIIERIKVRATSILLQPARTEATVDAFAGNTDTRIIDDYRGISVLSSYTPLGVPGLRWVLLAELDAHEAFAPVAQLRERLVFVGIVLLLLAAVVGVLVSRTISSPLVDLTSAAEEFGKGNLSHRATDTSPGEVGQLAHSFNRMAESLEEHHRRLQAEISERKRAEENVRASREELRNLSTHLQSVREEERQGMAREIHDELGQALSSLKLELALIREELVASPGVAARRIQSMSEVCDATIKSVKRIITELRPRLLDDLGLTAAIEWQAGEFRQHTGIPCSLTIVPDEITLDPERSTAIFRIFQETLTNISRHAHASRVTVQFRLDDSGVYLHVSDDGVGIREEQIGDSRSFGLLGMRERAHYWGGSVTIQRAPKRGTLVSVFLPGPFNQEHV